MAVVNPCRNTGSVGVDGHLSCPQSMGEDTRWVVVQLQLFQARIHQGRGGVALRQGAQSQIRM